jgi:hypothetical protein
MLCRSLFVLLSFSLAIVLSVLLRYTDSDYPFGIFKLSLQVLDEQAQYKNKNKKQKKQNKSKRKRISLVLTTSVLLGTDINVKL